MSASTQTLTDDTPVIPPAPSRAVPVSAPS